MTFDSPSIAPWLSVRDTSHAIDFYSRAFGAQVAEQTDTPDGPIARLAIDGADFWIAPDPTSRDGADLDGRPVRFVLSVHDPDVSFNQAIEAGAAEIFPVSEGHGWRVGRIVDPFGLHWEIGRRIVEPQI